MNFADLSRKPNILIIITDQEREAMHWPAGWADTNLPARRRLMANGLHFRRAQCSTAACSASRATFLTGLYPAQHGVKNLIACDNPKDPGAASTAGSAESAAEPCDCAGGWRLSRRAQGQAASGLRG